MTGKGRYVRCANPQVGKGWGGVRESSREHGCYSNSLKQKANPNNIEQVLRGSWVELSGIIDHDC